MKPNLDLLKTIVIVMMENRSFDHLLGYLSLPKFGSFNLDGLREDPDWKGKFANEYGGSIFHPFVLDDPYDLMRADPPHERANIALQMGNPVNGDFPMKGFVANYAQAKGAPAFDPGDLPPVMGYFTPEQVPVTDFLARNFAVCDHWFSSLPAGTQANRLMAMAGYSKIDVNTFPLSHHDLVYKWLTDNGVRWRVYHEDLPFFAMMFDWLPDILQETHFRPFKRLLTDVQNEPPEQFPQVVFVEPTYTDAPHVGVSSDDHAPSAIKGGQAFLLEVYRALTLIPDLWKGMVMVLTYDEHGGFFDHVSPPAIPTKPPPGSDYPDFLTLGVRVPGLVISPFVEPKTVFTSVLDHTSILKLIAQRFGGGKPYSPEVEKRNVGNVFDVLNRQEARDDIPVVSSLEAYLNRQPERTGYIPGRSPPSVIGESFQQALERIRDHPDLPPGKFDHLLQNFA